MGGRMDGEKGRGERKADRFMERGERGEGREGGGKREEERKY